MHGLACRSLASAVSDGLLSSLATSLPAANRHNFRRSETPGGASGWTPLAIPNQSPELDDAQPTASVVRPGTPAKSFGLRVSSAAPAAAAVVPMAMSAARFLETRGYETSRRRRCEAFRDGTTPSTPKNTRATASCSAVRGPRENSYQATALISIGVSELASSSSRSLSGPRTDSA